MVKTEIIQNIANINISTSDTFGQRLWDKFSIYGIMLKGLCPSMYDSFYTFKEEIITSKNVEELSFTMGKIINNGILSHNQLGDQEEFKQALITVLKEIVKGLQSNEPVL